MIKSEDVMRRKLVFSITGWILLSTPSVLGAENRYQAKHDHVVGSCRGELIFGETELEYATKNNEDARVWKYEDIQQLGLLGPQKISVLTYEDRKIQFGKDKRFNFELREGTVPESLWSFLRGRLSRPLVSEIIPSTTEAKYRLPAKHRHALGGCQGVLEIGDQYVVYKTPDESDSRVWRYEDLSTMGSTGPFQLRLSTMERTDGQYGAERNFIFDLKRRLDPAVYDFIWRKINDLGMAAGAN
jgi:hypothetical protein